MTPNLIFRVHTDLRLGLGHVARALAILEPWRALGGQAVLAVSGDERARGLGAGLHPLTGQPLPCEAVDLGEDLHAPVPPGLLSRAQAVLVDLWDATPEQLQALRPLKVALLEDDGDAHEAADLLFQPYLEGVKWTGPMKIVNGHKARPFEEIRGSCRVLKGSGFIVLGPEAARLRPKREPEQPLTVRRLLVSFGGTDGPGLALRAFQVMRSLVQSGRWMGSCTILSPGGIQEEPFRGCTLLPGMPNLTAHLQDFDALWCAAGLTLAEAMCMGVPAAAWGQNERQHRMIADLALNAGCFNLGLGTEANPKATEEALAVWLGPEGQETRQEQIRDGRTLVDGGGATRVAQELWALAGA